VAEVRAQLDSLGATKTRITVTSDLDEYGIAALAASPVDAYGVGTSVVTGSGAPAAGMVFKLVAHRNGSGEWVSVAKKSAQKLSIGGRKYPVRRLDEHGKAEVERIYIGEDPDETATERELLTPLVVKGEIDESHLGIEGTRRAREHHAAAIAELTPEAFRLRAGDPAIPTAYEG
jgi:nicotinate phosphoribosyltransferase